jgi:hypothetical protein
MKKIIKILAVTCILATTINASVFAGTTIADSLALNQSGNIGEYYYEVSNYSETEKVIYITDGKKECEYIVSHEGGTQIQIISQEGEVEKLNLLSVESANIIKEMDISTACLLFWLVCIFVIPFPFDFIILIVVGPTIGCL